MNLKNYLKRQIQQQGPISVAEFMQLALMHPEYGYYQKQQPFGKQGDFITAPEISQLFGEMVAVWVAAMWQQMGCPKDWQLVELGPGRGVLMQDILRATKHIEGFHACLSIVMVEQSSALQKVQKDRLIPIHNKIEWHETIDRLLPKPTLIVANEFFDALPIYQYVKANGAVHERVIGLENDALCFTLGAKGVNTQAVIEIAAHESDGKVIEASPASVHIVEQLAAHTTVHGGAALLIDYGYEMPACGDTLQAVKAHQYHPILEDVGEADITAHVNFTALAEAAKQGGSKEQKIMTQEEFLKQMGIELRARLLQSKATQEQKKVIEESLTRLVSPEEMGTLFKVLMII